MTSITVSFPTTYYWPPYPCIIPYHLLLTSVSLNQAQHPVSDLCIHKISFKTYLWPVYSIIIPCNYYWPLYPGIILYNPLPTSYVSLFHSLQGTFFLYIIQITWFQTPFINPNILLPISLSLHQSQPHYSWHLYTRFITFYLHFTSVFLQHPQQPTSEAITTHYTHALYTGIIPYKLLYWPLYPCNIFYNLLLASVSLYHPKSHDSVLLFQCIIPYTQHLYPSIIQS